MINIFFEEIDEFKLDNLHIEENIEKLIENKLSKKEKTLFEKELKELTTLFAIEFRKNNVEQRKKYNELMNK